MVMEEQQSDMELDSERVPVPQVPKSVEDSHVETVNNVTSISRSKPRLRKKALHAAILKQMEFYFSDANLSKDRFLKQLIENDPYVDINVFLQFNRIQELTTDVNRISKALEASTMLSLSEDGTKVHRITPIRIKENTDDCTVYVQNLPPDADHDMVQSLFSEYGPVVYVSLPRYKHNRKIKGFAFVEFDTPECIQKCLKAFQKKGCVLPSHTAPDELLSITTFEDAEKSAAPEGKSANSTETVSNEANECVKSTDDTEESEKIETERNTSLENDEEKEHAIANNASDLCENKNKKKAKKRKHKDTEPVEADDAEKQIDSGATKSKKKKLKLATDVHSDETEQTNEKQNDNSSKDTPQKSNKRKRSVSVNKEETLDNGDDSEQTMTEDSAVATVKEQEDTREKKKKKNKRKHTKRTKTEDIRYNVQLQVMAKRDWKYLRNKYLELQKSKMKQLKQHLRKTRWNRWSNYDKGRLEKEENDEAEKMSIQDNESKSRVGVLPGVIVKIQMDKPCTDPKDFKLELKRNTFVKYVDVKEGSFLAYVRFETADAAQTFVQKSNEENHVTIIDGEEEKLYWDKISCDREEKLSKTIRTKQRGRNKLLKKAEKELGKHIKFDEV